jgi:hypothetical protein
MPRTIPIVVPFPLTNRLDPADFVRGGYNAGLTGDARYRLGDLVTTRAAAGVARSVEDTTASVVEKLAIAGQDWSMPKAFPYFLARGVPLNRIDRRDEWVFTLQGEYDTDAQALVKANAALDVLFNATEKALTVREATASPTVKVLRVFEGEAGDTNVRVVVNFIEGKLL